MTAYVHYNGQLYDAEEPLITAGNRGLRYGDGLFETILSYKGQMPLLHYHIDRLWFGIQTLHIELPGYFTADYLEQEIRQLCIRNNLVDCGRIRLSVFRGNGTAHAISGEPCCVLIEAVPLAGLQFTEKGLRTGVYPGINKSCDVLANLKTNNYLPYIMAVQYAQQQDWEDAFILNTRLRICESAISNVFWIAGHVLYTPPLSEGCVAGVMRRYILEHAQDAGFRVSEKELEEGELEQAEEVFLTNAVQPVRWVQQFGSITYQHTRTVQLYRWILKNFSTKQTLV